MVSIDSAMTGDALENRINSLLAMLADLYIRTPEQLQEAVKDPETIKEVRLVLQGRLLPAVIKQLDGSETVPDHIPTLKELEEDEKKHPKRRKSVWKPPPRLVRTLEVVRIDINQLSHIDTVTQTFRV